MSHMVQFAILAGIALLAATVAGVTGFGGAAILLPVLVLVFGTRDAIPILTVVQLVGNGSRVWFNRRSINLAVVKWFSLGGVPAAVVGAIIFAKAPLPMLNRFLGVFLILLCSGAIPSMLACDPAPIRGTGRDGQFPFRTGRQCGAIDGPILCGLRFDEDGLRRHRGANHSHYARHQAGSVWPELPALRQGRRGGNCIRSSDGPWFICRQARRRTSARTRVHCGNRSGAGGSGSSVFMEGMKTCPPTPLETSTAISQRWKTCSNNSSRR